MGLPVLLASKERRLVLCYHGSALPVTTSKYYYGTVQSSLEFAAAPFVVRLSNTSAQAIQGENGRKPPRLLIMRTSTEDSSRTQGRLFT